MPKVDLGKEMMWTVPGREDPDWGFARNRQVMLRASRGEFSASSFSTSLDVQGRLFVGGNRDFGWQGLTIGPLGRSSYRILDGIYFSVGQVLEPLDVKVAPRRAIYRYRDGDGDPVRMVLDLEGQPGRVVLRSDVGRACWFMALMDVRELDTGRKIPTDQHNLKGELVLRGEFPLLTRVSGFDEILSSGLSFQWDYKLDDGFRRRNDGAVVFQDERRTIEGIVFHSRRGLVEIEVEMPTESSLAAPDLITRKIFGKSKISRALRLRLANLTSFDLFTREGWMPEAGAWWFRMPWIRDTLEGIRWNLKTYIRILGWRKRLAKTVKGLLDVARRERGLPIILDGGKSFTSDGFPQLLNVGCMLASITGDRELLRDVLATTDWMGSRLLQGRTVSGSLLRESVICSPANSSWIDSVVEVDGKRWPTRLPGEWRGEGIDPFNPHYGLVEVNAMYIEALNRIEIYCGRMNLEVSPEIRDLREMLEEGFMEHFHHEGSVPALTTSPVYDLRDPMCSSAGVIALSVLAGHLYTRGRIEDFWKPISERLLVHREIRELGTGSEPFGLLVRDMERSPYLGDGEYHGAVIWPRDTPYLIGLMEKMGMEVTGLLLNNLDHSISEGAIGFGSELFSLPVGGNPCPTSSSENPVPVKNPAQYWSHWCDPFLGHFDELE